MSDETYIDKKREDETVVSPQDTASELEELDAAPAQEDNDIIDAGVTSPYSLYNESLASFTTGDLYDHHDADGFITLFGLPLKVRAMKMAEVKAAQKEN